MEYPWIGKTIEQPRHSQKDQQNTTNSENGEVRTK